MPESTAPSATPTKLHSVDVAASLLSLSTKMARRLIERRELRAVRVGRRVLVSDREISRFIAAREAA